MVHNIIIGVLIYLGMMGIISLFLQGCTKNERIFEEKREYEAYMKKQKNEKSQNV